MRHVLTYILTLCLQYLEMVNNLMISPLVLQKYYSPARQEKCRNYRDNGCNRESGGAEVELKQIRWAEMIILFYRQCLNRGNGGLHHSGVAEKVCMTPHIVCGQTGSLLLISAFHNEPNLLSHITAVILQQNVQF